MKSRKGQRLCLLAFAWQLLAAAPLLAQDAPEIQPLEPERVSQRGDYEVEHYTLRTGDHIRFRIRGVYRVGPVEEDSVLLIPDPPRRSAAEWSVPVGRIAIGNRHKMILRQPDLEAGTANIEIEYKVRWHWWDAFGF